MFSLIAPTVLSQQSMTMPHSSSQLFSPPPNELFSPLLNEPFSPSLNEPFFPTFNKPDSPVMPRSPKVSQQGSGVALSAHTVNRTTLLLLPTNPQVSTHYRIIVYIPQSSNARLPWSSVPMHITISCFPDS